jgi:hypothetical protein
VPIDQSETDDAFDELERLGFDARVFTFMPANYGNLGSGIAPVVADMQVINTANGKEKTYKAGSGESWVFAFSEDLKAGFYGRPDGK